MKLDALIDWYSTLTPETISDMRGIHHESADFRDPFNEVRGHRAIAAIFEHMFDTTENPQIPLLGSLLHYLKSRLSPPQSDTEERKMIS